MGGGGGFARHNGFPRSPFFMTKIGVGIIGASPLRPGWAVAAHLPALASLPDYELRAVATSSEASAKAAGDAYGVPAYSDPSLLIARPDVDLVVVTVRLAHHHALISEAVAAGKMVMSEWPLGVDISQSTDIAARVTKTDLLTLIGLQAPMAPSLPYSPPLVDHAFVLKVPRAPTLRSGTPRP